MRPALLNRDVKQLRWTLSMTSVKFGAATDLESEKTTGFALSSNLLVVGTGFNVPETGVGRGGGVARGTDRGPLAVTEGPIGAVSQMEGLCGAAGAPKGVGGDTKSCNMVSWNTWTCLRLADGSGNSGCARTSCRFSSNVD